MISAVAILMLCNGIRISLKSKKYNQRNRVCHGVHDTPFSFLHFFHWISRMNRKAFLLIGLLTEFRGYLASGQWLAPDICSCCFCHADFADDADFSLCGLFCPTDFSLWGLFRPTDFTDIHRFFFVGHIPIPGGICTDRTGRLRENPCVIASSGKPPNKFRVIR